jgi:hypothetical protein
MRTFILTLAGPNSTRHVTYRIAATPSAPRRIAQAVQSLADRLGVSCWAIERSVSVVTA